MHVSRIAMQAVGITHPSTLDAMMSVDRSTFSIEAGHVVPNAYGAAMLLQSVCCENPETVLEIGTGSGYFTTLLLAAMPELKVCSIERSFKMYESARGKLEEQFRPRLSMHHGDGTQFVPDDRFDAVVITARCSTDEAMRFLRYTDTVFFLKGALHCAVVQKISSAPICVIGGATPLLRGVTRE